jgi:glyoxalase family protein
LVKETVNFDAPDVYHFDFEDELGRPGTILTFFPFPNAARGKRGAGETSAVAFSVPSGSLEFWTERPFAQRD